MKPHSCILAAAFVTLTMSTACGGNSLDGGSARGGDLGAADSDLGADGGNPIGPRLAAAMLACNAAHGPVDPATTPADTEQKLTGAWYLCSAPNVFKLSKSIEFAADGTYYILESDGAGDLKRGQGIDGSGRWKVQGGGSRYVEPGPFFPQFETSPRRFKMTVGTSGFENWYVALD